MRPPGRRPGLPEARKFQVTPRKILFFVLFLFAVPLAVLMTALLSDIFCNQYHMCTKATAPAHPDADDDPDLTADHVVMETLDVPAGAQPETLLTPPSLTLEQYLATKRRDQPVIVALTNMGYADMASNFLCSMQRLGLNNTLMFATDLASYSYLTRLHYDVFYLNSSKSAAGATWGSKAFNTFVKEKVRAVKEVVSLGYEVFFCDLDMVWKRDLSAVLPTAARADRLPEVDGRQIGQLEGDKHEDGSGWDYAIYYYKAHSNTGFYYMRSNNRTVELMRNWLDCCGRVPVDDQDTFDGLTDLHLRGKRLSRIKYVWARCKDLQRFLRRVLLSSREYFPNGSDFFVLRYPQRAKVTPFLLHANQIPGGKRAKIKVMKEFGEWLIEDDGRCKA